MSNSSNPVPNLNVKIDGCTIAVDHRGVTITRNGTTSPIMASTTGGTMTLTSASATIRVGPQGLAITGNANATRAATRRNIVNESPIRVTPLHRSAFFLSRRRWRAQVGPASGLPLTIDQRVALHGWCETQWGAAGRTLPWSRPSWEMTAWGLLRVSRRNMLAEFTLRWQGVVVVERP